MGTERKNSNSWAFAPQSYKECLKAISFGEKMIEQHRAENRSFDENIRRLEGLNPELFFARRLEALEGLFCRVRQN